MSTNTPMINLATDVNDELSKTIIIKEDSDKDIIELTESEQVKDNIISQIPTDNFRKDIKEIILIVTIYFILSTEYIKSQIGKYVKYINPDNEGNVSFIGVLIYGLLLGVIFIMTKTILNRFI